MSIPGEVTVFTVVFPTAKGERKLCVRQEKEYMQK